MTAILETVAEQARELLHERAEKMLAAWNENIEEAHENDDDFPPLKLSVAVTVNLEKNNIETALAFTTRYKATTNCSLPDPDHPDLPGVA